MVMPFDLFREEAEGTVHWLGAVLDVAAAKKKARQFMTLAPGKYFVYGQTTGNKLYMGASRY